MKTSKIDRETYKRNKVKELMSLNSESDDEWFDENSLKIKNEVKTENLSFSHENKNEEGKKDLLTEIEDLDFNDTLSSRLDAFQEKINAMLAEGNKMLNQSFSRDNIDILSPSYSSTSTSNSKKRRHRHSHNKQKVAFANDVINKDDHSEMSTSNSDLNNSLNSSIDNISSNFSLTNIKNVKESSSKRNNNRKIEKPRKSENSQKLSGKDMLQDAISFSKLVLNKDKKKSPELLTNKRSSSPKPILETKNNNNNNKNIIIKSKDKISNDKTIMIKNGSIDSMLSKTFSDGELILQSNELELLRIELKELKEKNKQLEQENMNLKIQNVSLTEKQKQQEQQIENLKQTNSHLKRLVVSDTAYSFNGYVTPPSSYPSSPYIGFNNQDIPILSPDSDNDWIYYNNNTSINTNNNNDNNNNNNSFISSSTISNNIVSTINHEILNSALNKINNNSNSVTAHDTMNKSFSGSGDDSFDNGRRNTTKSIKNIRNINHRRFSFPQRLQSTDDMIKNIEDDNNDISSSGKNQFNLISNTNIIGNKNKNRNRNSSNIFFYTPSQKNKILLNTKSNKRHSMFADIKSYDKIIEGWKSIENKDTIVQSQSNNNNNNDSNNNSNNENIENIENSKTDKLNNSNNNNTMNQLSNKKYSFVYPNNDKTKRYSFASDISPFGEIKYDVNEYIDKLNKPDIANNKTRNRKISESCVNDLRHSDNILKDCPLSPPLFKYPEMKKNDLLINYKKRFSSSILSTSSSDHKEDKGRRRRSILDQISYIRIDEESATNTKYNKTHYNSISIATITNNIGSDGITTDTTTTTINNNNNNNITTNNNINDDIHINEMKIDNPDSKVEINHLNNRLSMFKNQIQNVQKDLTDMLECEKRIQDLLLPVNNLK